MRTSEDPFIEQPWCSERYFL